jgi:hypothetical protein
MIYNSLSEIPYRKEQAIIINAGTKLSATLALFSAIKFVDMPVLLVNCTINLKNINTLNDYSFFLKLQNTVCFDMIELPLKKHGDTLDIIFSSIKADNVLLIDSDIEILNRDAISFMKKYIGLTNVFGTGFIHGPLERVLNIQNGYYAERMWIPFTLLKVIKIRMALQDNKSFNLYHCYNDFPINKRISKIIYKLERKIERTLKIFNLFRKKYGNIFPSVVLYDTGAEIYKYLKEQKKFEFIGCNNSIYPNYVTHYNGITRKLLDNDDSTGNDIKKIEALIKQRLIEHYHLTEID